ncbi:fimbrial biogenesis chaperone [Brevundimonas sp. Root1279]|uniref:fimbrial biogenesis chaperone n=1 Tax=Brevundimonas sp. Root1279 TaxID=1736443 RepID=UPI000700AC03|nr:molecular chaperone [Brevundimonas sp. Root1279]KQW82298.1 hypothetical protein ASC65_08475 [Brevundimonas sp. Root1279]
MPRLRALAGLALAAFLVATAPAAPAIAGSLEIGPIRLQMIGPERTATLTIRNVDSAPVTVQIRTVDWTQPNGEDVYTPSALMLVSPPLVTLAPGESQVVRVVIENLPEAPTERAFRLILDELPPEPNANATGVQTAIRALVPVFVTPSTAARPNLSWSAIRSGDQLVVTAANRGDSRDRLINLSVAADGQALNPYALDGYVLAGGSRSWTLPAGSAQAGAITISAEGEYGTVEANVPVTP